MKLFVRTDHRLNNMEDMIYTLAYQLANLTLTSKKSHDAQSKFVPWQNITEAESAVKLVSFLEIRDM